MPDLCHQLIDFARASCRGHFVVLTLSCCLLGAGCRSTHEPAATAPFAAVVIHGNTPGQIKAVAQEVFEANGFHLASGKPNDTVYEKPAGGWDNFVYGGLIDSSMWLRVKLQVALVGETACRLQCQAFLLRDHGGATEEELPLSRHKHKSYQKILDEVAARLGQRQG